jgi:fibronectin-binding autotransporter adhesin
LGWRSKVHGDASGIPDRAVGHLRGRADYAGAYWTYTGDTGGYGDVVLQHGRQRGNASAITGSDSDIRARSTLASLETGVPLPLGRQWQAEPQAQLIFAHRHIDDVSIAAATVRQHPGNATVARLGVRLKGDYSGAHGTARPYMRFNLWHGLSGSDTQSIAGPGGNARIDTRRGYTSGEIAAGGTWTINRRIALYGELGHLFPLGGEQRVSTRRAISAGMRIAW